MEQRERKKSKWIVFLWRLCVCIYGVICLIRFTIWVAKFSIFHCETSLKPIVYNCWAILNKLGQTQSPWCSVCTGTNFFLEHFKRKYVFYVFYCLLLLSSGATNSMALLLILLLSHMHMQQQHLYTIHVYRCAFAKFVCLHIMQCAYAVINH